MKSVRKGKIYRHSTTFYRKLKERVTEVNECNASVKHHFAVGKLTVHDGPSAFSSLSTPSAIEVQDSVGTKSYLESEDRNGSHVSELDNFPVASEDDCRNNEEDEEENSLILQISLVEQLKAWYHSHSQTHSSRTLLYSL